MTGLIIFGSLLIGMFMGLPVCLPCWPRALST